MIVALSVLTAAGALSYSSFKLGKHTERNVNVGCSSATQEMMAHESWEAVVDSEYVYNIKIRSHGATEIYQMYVSSLSLHCILYCYLKFQTTCTFIMLLEMICSE